MIQQQLNTNQFVSMNDSRDAGLHFDEYINYTNVPYENWFYVAYLGIGGIFGILGNILVIYASYNYGTFDVGRVAVIFIRNLAVADLAFIFIYPIPIFIMHVKHEWVLGELICKITGTGCTVPVTANINFILAMSVHRFVSCRYPFQERSLTPSRG